MVSHFFANFGLTHFVNTRYRIVCPSVRIYDHDEPHSAVYVCFNKNKFPARRIWKTSCWFIYGVFHCLLSAMWNMVTFKANSVLLRQLRPNKLREKNKKHFLNRPTTTMKKGKKKKKDELTKNGIRCSNMSC